MKSKILWQCSAFVFLSFILPACKKEIKQPASTQQFKSDGTVNTLDVTCISNGIQFFKTESLSQARGILGLLGIGLSNNVLFIQGLKQNGAGSKRVDIYNTSSDSWTVKILSEAKIFQAIAAGGTKIGIAGGEDATSGGYSKQVDIYDVNSNTWTISHLSVKRGAAAGVGYGDSLYFAGGLSPTPHKTIDVYNTLNGSWSKLSLSLARFKLAAAATNNKILFAGGEHELSKATDRVDIYDVHTGTWSVSALSETRTELVGAALGNLIIFGGGFDTNGGPNGNGHRSDVIDIYNTSTGQWSVTHISSATGWSQSAVQGTKMFFGGAGNSSSPSVVDVYDICSNTWSKLSLTDGRGDFGVGAAGGKVLFGGGDFGDCSSCAVVNTVDIFNLGPLIAQ